ncbi:hypothetical protein NEOLI_005245, partial [Neolecta irregularis DAH-3]
TPNPWNIADLQNQSSAIFSFTLKYCLSRNINIYNIIVFLNSMWDGELDKNVLLELVNRGITNHELNNLGMKKEHHVTFRLLVNHVEELADPSLRNSSCQSNANTRHSMEIRFLLNKNADSNSSYYISWKSDLFKFHKIWPIQCSPSLQKITSTTSIQHLCFARFKLSLVKFTRKFKVTASCPAYTCNNQLLTATVSCSSEKFKWDHSKVVVFPLDTNGRAMTEFKKVSDQINIKSQIHVLHVLLDFSPEIPSNLPVIVEIISTGIDKYGHRKVLTNKFKTILLPCPESAFMGSFITKTIKVPQDEMDSIVV